MKNLSQATYDRLIAMRDSAHWPRPCRQDALDLLEAYEGAMVLLEQLTRTNNGAPDCLMDAAEDFLYLPHDSGRPKLHRVVLDDGEPLSYSARGMLRPAEVDSEDY